MKTLFKMPPRVINQKIVLPSPTIKTPAKTFPNTFQHQTSFQPLPKFNFNLQRFAQINLRAPNLTKINQTPVEIFATHIEAQESFETLENKIHPSILAQIISEKEFSMGQVTFRSYLEYCQKYKPSEIVKIVKSENFPKYYSQFIDFQLAYESFLRTDELNLNVIEHELTKLEVHNAFAKPVYTPDKVYPSTFHYAVENPHLKIYAQIEQCDYLKGGLEQAKQNPHHEIYSIAPAYISTLNAIALINAKSQEQDCLEFFKLFEAGLLLDHLDDFTESDICSFLSKPYTNSKTNLTHPSLIDYLSRPHTQAREDTARNHVVMDKLLASDKFRHLFTVAKCNNHHVPRPAEEPKAEEIVNSAPQLVK